MTFFSEQLYHVNRVFALKVSLENFFPGITVFKDEQIEMIKIIHSLLVLVNSTLILRKLASENAILDQYCCLAKVNEERSSPRLMNSDCNFLCYTDNLGSRFRFKCLKVIQLKGNYSELYFFVIFILG